MDLVGQRTQLKSRNVKCQTVYDGLEDDVPFPGVYSFSHRFFYSTLFAVTNCSYCYRVSNIAGIDHPCTWGFYYAAMPFQGFILSSQHVFLDDTHAKKKIALLNDRKMTGWNLCFFHSLQIRSNSFIQQFHFGASSRWFLGMYLDVPGS